MKHNVVKTCLIALLAALWCFPVYAGGWQEQGDVWYYFDDAGEMQTGWVQASDDQLWYYLDSETGAWVRRPTLDDTAVVKLLENEIRKMGYYQYEDGEVFVQVDWRDETKIYASARKQTGPNDVATLNTYEINKRSGKVTAAMGGNFSLYQ